MPQLNTQVSDRPIVWIAVLLLGSTLVSCCRLSLSRSTVTDAAQASGGMVSSLPPAKVVPNAQPKVTLRLDQPGNPVPTHALGMNLHVTQDIARPGVVELLRRIHARLVRWPGGSESDHYQWRTNRLAHPWVAHPNAAFDQFMNRLVKPAQVAVAITLNYGSNAAGTGGGDPQDAADWVAHAKARGYAVAYWTVGNEVFGSWATDRNAKRHDANTYANRVAQEFYPRIKTADPRAPVGVVVNQYDLRNPWGWTQTVLRQAKYDFVEIHYYPQSVETASDEFLLNGAIAQFQQHIADLRQSMGKRPVPILLGEFNNVPNRPNKQTLSIVNALYHGLIFAESAQMGLLSAMPWELLENYCTHDPQSGQQPTGNFSDALYGWQTFATYSAFSPGFPNASNSCNRGVPPLPFGTPFPSAQAATLFGEFALPQARWLKVEPASAANLRIYAATTPRQGDRILLFNLNRNTTLSFNLALKGGSGPWLAQQETYGKAEYDQSRQNRWVG
ncbi:MAG TPA: hypothetical protein V6D19_11550, partial [Stenomitos sp.]